MRQDLMKLAAILAISSVYGMGFTASVLGAFKHELAVSLRIDNARIGGTGFNGHFYQHGHVAVSRCYD